MRQRRITALNAVTATTTSSKFWVGGAKRIGIHLRRANHSAGASAFTFKGSIEPLEFGNGPMDAFGNPTGGTGVTVTPIDDNINSSDNGETLSANGDSIVWLPNDGNQFLLNWLEVTVTETTDGTHSAWIVVEEELPQMAGF